MSETLPRDGQIVAAVRSRCPKGVDAIIDLVSREPGSYDTVLRDGGRIASPTFGAGDGPGRTNIVAKPTLELLDRIARWLAGGSLQVPIQRTYDLADAPKAMQVLEATHTQGEARNPVQLRRGHASQSATASANIRHSQLPHTTGKLLLVT